MDQRTTEYDYIIVGGGSAGSVLAYRLSEDAGVRVLVLEAGGPDRDPLISIPLGVGKILLERLHDWDYFTEPEAHLGDRRVEFARGKVLGGSSSVNAMAYVRGRRGDYDRWASEYGLTDWSFDAVLPYFIKQETWAGEASSVRGRAGPLSVRYSGFQDPLLEAYLRSAQAAGHRVVTDLNADDRPGFGRSQVTIGNGRRCSNARAYLAPACRRPNVDVITRALVTKVMIRHGRAEGVQYLQGKTLASVHARKEVVLCGGVVNSPQLLMLSGVGPSHSLRALGIAVESDVAGVGENLQDHLGAMVGFTRKEQGPFHRRMRFDRVLADMARAYAFGTGPATDLPGGITGFACSRSDLSVPDLQYFFAAGALKAGPYLRPFVQPFVDAFSVRAVNLHPQSRGTVSITSTDPTVPARIQQRFLSYDSEWASLRWGLRSIRDIMAQPLMRDFVVTETTPGKQACTDDALNDHIRRTAVTAHHPVGTCRMGSAPDDGGVVDAQLRVFGVDRLRVVDASVIPEIVSGNTNAAVTMIAEKAADLIRGSVH